MAMDKEKIQANVLRLIASYKAGKLGGEKMPEDENPCLAMESKENYLYFTLPMALNYQRNSYTLWENANKTYQDHDTGVCFVPEHVVAMPPDVLQGSLLKYKVALQPNKQPIIWGTLCDTIHTQFEGDIRNLFVQACFSVAKVKQYIAKNKKAFPYLGGKKILNYWLYVMEQYTDVKFTDRQNITIAPDTHVVQASCKLGVINDVEKAHPYVQDLVAERWVDILADTAYCPIDIHTPLWLWSRGKFEGFTE